jgi:uncharacterized protein with HEPN domain
VVDIVDAIHRVFEYTEGAAREDFEEDPKTVDAVVRNFIVIGEAARGIPEEIAGRYSAVPWRANRSSGSPRPSHLIRTRRSARYPSGHPM